MNQDLISRKWLIECVEEGWIKFDTEKDKNIFIHLVRDTAPSVQPQKNDETCDSCRYRYKEWDEDPCDGCTPADSGYCPDSIELQPPISKREWYMKGYRDAQPVSCTDLCVDCPLFDHEKHECPRFNRVIPRAIEEVKPRWIPFETREPDAEEKQEHPEWDFVLCGKLPQDGQRILVNIKYKGHEAVQMDEYNDDGRECYLHSGYDIATEATAWMPLPEPWREQE